MSFAIVFGLKIRTSSSLLLLFLLHFLKQNKQTNKTISFLSCLLFLQRQFHNFLMGRIESIALQRKFPCIHLFAQYTVGMPLCAMEYSTISQIYFSRLSRSSWSRRKGCHVFIIRVPTRRRHEDIFREVYMKIFIGWRNSFCPGGEVRGRFRS